jgi:hypothetical protein
MKKNKLNNIIGLTLVEILIGIVVSMLMMGAMYTSYSIVNDTYSQVTSRATISQSGRDVVGMMMRDIRMAGFQYYGDTTKYVPGDTASTLEKSHAPLIITKEKPSEFGIIDIDDKCCDQIDIVYGDYNFDPDPAKQQFLRYKITYYGERKPDSKYYEIRKSKKKWNESANDWEVCDDICFEDAPVRDYLVDMEFIATDRNGKVIDPPPTPTNSNSNQLFSIKAVDVRLTFRSKNDFFKTASTTEKPRLMQGLGNRSREFFDKFIRESIVVSIHTRNIGAIN